MDYSTQFFPLLNEALYKVESKVPKHIITNSDVFLMVRYASFYDPHLVELLNEFNKKTNIYFTNCGQYLYEVFSSLIPKLRKKYIKYISKNKDKKIKDSNKFVVKYAEEHEMSEREVWGLLYQAESLNLIN